MGTDTPHDPQLPLGGRDSAGAKGPRTAIVVGSLVVAAAVAIGLVFKFPNLRERPGYFVLAVVTPLLAGLVVALSGQVLRRSVASPLTLALRLALALALVLDFGFFVLVGFIQTEAHDTAPVFVTRTVTAAPSASVTPSTVIKLSPTPPALRTGTFDHRQGIDTAAGNTILGATADGSFVLRLEHFEASHGPDLYVYLVEQAAPNTSAQVMSGFEVAALNATSGDQNYTLPNGLDTSKYQSVVIYCKSFSVIFGYATLF